MRHTVGQIRARPGHTEVTNVAHDGSSTTGIPAADAEPRDDRPLVAEDVAAAYIADAVRAVPGVAALHESHWKALSGKMRSDCPSKGVVVRSVAPNTIEVDVHVKVAWGTAMPDLAHEVAQVVSRNTRSLLDLDVRKTTLYVDDIDAPPVPA